ncbi:MAG: diacylglycerol kinase family protein [Crocinitomicaceae bacterium]|jgi:diacylglycerol kinase
MKNMNETPFSLRNRIKSFSYAFRGLKTFFQTQHNAWIHALATVIVIILGNMVKLSTAEWLWIGLAIALVFITEMLNTAIEFLTDLVSPEYHPLAKKTKDVAAGAVLIAAFFAVIIGILVFTSK